jgi:hypothetical protein
MTWRHISANGQLPRPRERHATGFIGKSMFVYGGVCDSQIYEDMLYFNTGILPPPPPP